MKNKLIVVVLGMICCLICVCGCGKEQTRFTIKTSDDTYYLDQQNEVKLSIDTVELSKEDKDKVVSFEVVGKNEIEATIKDDFFSAKHEGTVEIVGKIGETESENKLTITVTYTDDYYDNQAKSKLETIMNAQGGVIFGMQYDIGLNKEYAKNIVIENGDGIFIIGENGTLDVVGIGQGRVYIKNILTNTVLYDSYYAVHNAVLCTYIKDDLIGQNIISSTADVVTNDMLENIKEISLSGELINDPTISNALKLLSNIEIIDLSNNGISDASFLKPLTKLKSVNLSNNALKDISSIVDNQNLEYLDLENNDINSINKIQFMQKIKYLNLTDNSLKDISPLSSSYGLESVFLNGNETTNFKDSISGLTNLKELGIGKCGIDFTDIISLKYLPNLTYLDISGTNPNLDTVCNLTKLKTLILKDCKLYDKNLTKLNSLTNIEVLDISENGLQSSNYNHALSGSSLTNLKELRIGGNEFGSIPDLSSFANLKTLDLTNSYNLSTLSSISSLNIDTLILDECNTLTTEGYLDSINSLTNLKRLSIISGFNYMTKSLYDSLMGKVESGSISLRFVSNDYIDKDSISDYERAVFFNLTDFLIYCEQDTEILNKYTVGRIDNAQQIVLSLTNENNVDLIFDIDKSLFKLDLYGDVNKTYNIRFNVLDRKQSSFTLELHNINIVNNDNETIITAADGSKVNIISYGNSSFTSIYNSSNENNKKAVIEVFDLKIINMSNKSQLSIIGYNGANGKENPNHDYCEDRRGDDGMDGQDAIICHSINIKTGAIKISGGNGGNGGNGSGPNANRFFSLIWQERHGGDGGNGGNGGNAIIYKLDCVICEKATIIGGIGGNAGNGGSGQISAENGKSGSAGANGQATLKK